MKNLPQPLATPIPLVSENVNNHTIHKRNCYQHHYLKEIIDTATHTEQSSKGFHIERSAELPSRLVTDASYLSNRADKV